MQMVVLNDLHLHAERVHYVAVQITSALRAFDQGDKSSVFYLLMLCSWYSPASFSLISPLISIRFQQLLADVLGDAETFFELVNLFNNALRQGTYRYHSCFLIIIISYCMPLGGRCKSRRMRAYGARRSFPPRATTCAPSVLRARDSYLL